MKFGSPFPDVISRVDALARQARDFIAPARHLRVSITDAKPNLVLDDGSGARPFTVTDLVHEQLAEATSVPMPYYRRMLSETPELLANNLNTWLGRSGGRHLIRTIGGPQPIARALLSDRYRPLDHEALLAAILPTLRDEGVTIESCELTERRLYVKALNRRVTGEVKVGQTVMAGILISNSEVGLGALEVRPLVFTLACTNGLIVEDLSLRKHHLGKRHGASEDGIQHLLSNETREADDRAFFLKVRDVCRGALDAAVFRQQIGKLQAAAREAIDPGAAEQVVEVTAKRWHLLDDERQAVLAHFRVAGEFSRWGLSSAITRHAQDVTSYDRSTELERIGGQVVEAIGQFGTSAN